jgi:hypothetical protein
VIYRAVVDLGLRSADSVLCETSRYDTEIRDLSAQLHGAIGHCIKVEVEAADGADPAQS